MPEYTLKIDDFKPPLRWHPRITPFRLAFILSTTTLGIAKAVLVSRDDTISSTTVEWVTCVVLGPIFQLLSPLDACEHHNRFSRFVFSQDCFAPLWKILPRPVYIDDERSVGTLRKAGGSSDLQKYDLHRWPALVTPYRLVVSAVTTGLGIIKMICAYTGLDTTMNAVDWAFSAPVLLLLYYVGLYENNTVGLGRRFFESDCSEGVIFVAIQALYALVISGTCVFVPYWFDFWYSLAIDTLNDQFTMLDTPLANDPIPPWVHNLHDQSFVILGVFAMAVCALLGVTPLLALILHFAGSIMNAAKWALVRARRLVPTNSMLTTVVSRLGAFGSAAQPYTISVWTYLVVVSLYALAIFLCFVLGIFALRLGLRLFPSLYLRTDVVVLKVLNIVMGLAFGATSYAPFRGGIVVLKELLQRLSPYRRNAGRSSF